MTTANIKTKKGKVRNSLRSSFYDGIFSGGMVGFTQDYFTPFLLVLKGTSWHVALLSALPNFFASLVQVKGAEMVDRLKSRKKIITIFVFLQAAVLVPIAAMAFSAVTKPLLFIVFAILFTAFGAISLPAWGSLMSDLVTYNKRGAYFGWRGRALGFVTIAAAFGAGAILNAMKEINIFYGFAFIFVTALVFRSVSLFFLSRMYEPRLEYKKEHYFSLLDFIASMRKSNFARFVLFVALMNFSVNLASPFFVVLMLKELHFSYFLYTSITLTATLTIYLTISRWGRHADKVGNLKIIKFTSPLIGAIPLLWIFSQTPIFLFLAQALSGFIWAGFNICTSNFIYDAVTPSKRIRCISYFNVLNGLALCCGALCGGFLLQRLPALFGYRILTLFLISAVLRTIIGIIMPHRLKEVRSVEHVKHNELFFSIIGVRPLLGIERRTIRY